MPKLTKIASYGVMHLIVAVAVAYLLSGDLLLALSIGIVEPAVQTLAYALHEKAWLRRALHCSHKGASALA